MWARAYNRCRSAADRQRLAATLALVLLSGATVDPAGAATVAPMDANTLADFAGQVISGRVLSAESYWAENPRRLETAVTLQGVEYLKGPSFDPTGRFTLIVPGGTVGETGMRVCGAPRFQIGERWLLFLLPTYKTFPVVGIFRGSFRIVQDAKGIERVYNEDRQPVMGLDNAHQIMVADPGANPGTQAVEELGARVQTVTRNSPSNKAVTYESFRSMLAPILAHSRDYKLTSPAGQREPVQFTPSPMKAAVKSVIRGGAPVTSGPHLRGLDAVKEHTGGRAARPGRPR